MFGTSCFAEAARLTGPEAPSAWRLWESDWRPDRPGPPAQPEQDVVQKLDRGEAGHARAQDDGEPDQVVGHGPTVPRPRS